MKKLFGLTLSLAFLALARPAAADEFIDYVMYDSTTAAADAAIAIGPLNTYKAETLTIHFRNAGSQARSAVLEEWDPAGVGTISRHTIAVPATSDAHLYIDPQLSSTLMTPASYTLWSIKPPHKLKITAAAATGTMRTTVIKRTSR
jgi:hypothetical protein